MRTTIAELVAILSLDSTRFQAGATQAEASMSRMGRNLSTIGKRMSTMVTLPILAVGVATTKMAMDFETNMANIFTLMDDATIHSRDWKKEVLDLSKKVPQSTDVLSKGLYDIVSAGIDAGKSMDVLEVASKAATAGLSDAATSVKAITAVLNAYGMEAEEADKVSDILFTTVRTGVTTFPELSGAIGKVIGTAAAANVSFEEVGAALATITKGGINTQEAVVGLNQVILSFIKPTDQAKEAAEALGFDLSATALSTKGLGGAMNDLIERMGPAVDEIIAATESGTDYDEVIGSMAYKMGLTSEQFASLFPNVRALKGALSLARDGGSEFNAMLSEQEKALGATDDAFKKIAETTKFQFDLALSSLKATAIEMGSHLLPVAGELFDKIGKLADSFGNLTDSQQKTIIQILGIFAAMGPLLYISGQFLIILPKLTFAIQTFNTAMTTMATSAGIATGAISSVVVAAEALNYLLGSLVLEKYSTGLTKKFRELGEATDSNTKKFIYYGLEVSSGTESHINLIKKLVVAQEMAEKTGKGYWETLFTTMRLSREELVKWSDEQMRGTEIIESAQRFIEKYSETVPLATAEMDKLAQSFANGELSQQGFIIGIEELRRATQNGRVDIEDSSIAINDYADKQEIARRKVEAHTNAQKEAKPSIEDTTEATEEGTEATEEYAESVDDLIESLFKLYNLNQSVTEATWNYEDALENLNKVMADVNSTEREKQEALDDTQDEMEDLISAIWKEYEAEGISIERKKELMRQMGRVMGQAEEMGITLDEVAKDRITTMTMDATQALMMAHKVTEAMDRIPKKITTVVETSYTATGSASLRDFIAANRKAGGLILDSDIPKAQEGLLLSNNSNAVPALLHPPELVLNPEQAIRTLWHIANKPIDMATPSGNALPENLLIHNVIEMDREVLAEQINKINIDKDVVRV